MVFAQLCNTILNIHNVNIWPYVRVHCVCVCVCVCMREYVYGVCVSLSFCCIYVCIQICVYNYQCVYESVFVGFRRLMARKRKNTLFFDDRWTDQR